VESPDELFLDELELEDAEAELVAPLDPLAAVFTCTPAGSDWTSLTSFSWPNADAPEAVDDVPATGLAGRDSNNPCKPVALNAAKFLSLSFLTNSSKPGCPGGGAIGPSTSESDASSSMSEEGDEVAGKSR
jgi:hypothetical protein